MRRKSVLILIAIMVALAGVGIGLKVLTSPAVMPNALTITEARQDRTGSILQVKGDVVPGSIAWDYGAQSLTFTLTGDGADMKVAYAGQAPGDFKPGQPAIVKGKYDSTGIFRATSLTSANSPMCRTCHSS